MTDEKYCLRCGKPGEIIDGICGSCADDLRQEADAELMSHETEATYMAEAEAKAEAERNEHLRFENEETGPCGEEDD